MDLPNIVIVLIGDLDIWLKINKVNLWILEEMYFFNLGE